jgi:hypothetical protein
MAVVPPDAYEIGRDVTYRKLCRSALDSALQSHLDGQIGAAQKEMVWYRKLTISFEKDYPKDYKDFLYKLPSKYTPLILKYK